jgi:hypothetical protein
VLLILLTKTGLPQLEQDGTVCNCFIYYFYFILFYFSFFILFHFYFVFVFVFVLFFILFYFIYLLNNYTDAQFDNFKLERFGTGSCGTGNAVKVSSAILFYLLPLSIFLYLSSSISPIYLYLTLSPLSSISSHSSFVS